MSEVKVSKKVLSNVLTVYKNLYEQQKDTMLSWEKSGLLDNIEGEKEKVNVALLLESEAAKMIDYHWDNKNASSREMVEFHTNKHIEELNKGNHIGAQFSLMMAMNTQRSYIKKKYCE